jgi:uncharacterized membrane protein
MTGLMLIIMIVIWTLFVAGVLYLFRLMAGTGWMSSENTAVESSPLEILRKRYAEGEIGRDEFEEAVRNITRTR